MGRPGSEGALRWSRVTVSAAAALAVALGPVTAAGAQPAGTAQVRVAHLSPTTGGADVWVSPADGSQSQFAHDVTYGGITPYATVPAGTYFVSMFPTGSKRGHPLLQGHLTVVAGGVYTVAVTGNPRHLVDKVVNDELSLPPAGQAKVRVVQASTSVGSPNIRIAAGTVLASDVSYGTVTDYANVTSGHWLLTLSTAPNVSLAVTLAPGTVYSLLLLNGSDRATVRATVRATADASGTNSYVARSGDSLWSIAEATLQAALGRPATGHEVEGYEQKLISANQSRLSYPTNPNLIFPGQAFTLPPT